MATEGSIALRTKVRVRNFAAQSVDQVRQGMMGCGFALVNTPSFFRDGLHQRLSSPRTELDADDKRWRQFPDLARYGCWVETLLEKALPEEAVSLACLDFRHEPADLEDQEVDRLHADGYYIRSVYTLFGPTTIYRDQGVERSVLEGHTLLMTAYDRAKAVHRPCTLHRRPGAGPERALIVCSFELPSVRPTRARLYREVGQADNPRRKTHSAWFRADF
jgi:hypothetical protein